MDTLFVITDSEHKTCHEVIDRNSLKCHPITSMNGVCYRVRLTDGLNVFQENSNLGCGFHIFKPDLLHYFMNMESFYIRKATIPSKEQYETEMRKSNQTPDPNFLSNAYPVITHSGQTVSHLTNTLILGPVQRLDEIFTYENLINLNCNYQGMIVKALKQSIFHNRMNIFNHFLPRLEHGFFQEPLHVTMIYKRYDLMNQILDQAPTNFELYEYFYMNLIKFLVENNKFDLLSKLITKLSPQMKNQVFYAYIVLELSTKRHEIPQNHLMVRYFMQNILSQTSFDPNLLFSIRSHVFCEGKTDLFDLFFPQPKNIIQFRTGTPVYISLSHLQYYFNNDVDIRDDGLGGCLEIPNLLGGVLKEQEHNPTEDLTSSICLIVRRGLELKKFPLDTSFNWPLCSEKIMSFVRQINEAVAKNISLIVDESGSDTSCGNVIEVVDVDEVMNVIISMVKILFHKV